MQAGLSIRKFMWPLLSADFELIEKYKPASLEPLECDLTAIGALSDGRYSSDQVLNRPHAAALDYYKALKHIRYRVFCTPGIFHSIFKCKALVRMTALSQQFHNEIE